MIGWLICKTHVQGLYHNCFSPRRKGVQQAVMEISDPVQSYLGGLGGLRFGGSVILIKKGEVVSKALW